MARLPSPGSDSGTWGNILNDFLSQSLKSDGALKDAVVGSDQLQDNSVTASAIAPGSVTKSDVGLGSVDNTSDAGKPVSSATQTALNLKAPLNSPTFTGTVTLPDDTVDTSTLADNSVTAAKLATDIVQPVPLPQSQKKLANITNSPPARFKWLTYGDSYAQKIYGQIWSTLIAMSGAAAGAYGSQSTGILGGITINSTSGTVTGNTTDFTRWPTGGTETYSTGASRTYGSGGSAFTADTIKVYYAKESGGGTFKIQVDGIDAAGHTNISAAGTLGQLGIATVSTTAGAHTVTVVNLTGTMTLVAIGYESSTISGLVSVNVSQGGISLSSATATAYSNFQAFLADVLPDLMTLEVKEDSASLPGSLSTLFAATAAGAPTMDVLGIGSTPVATNDADQILQNIQLRDAAVAAGYKYWDSYGIFGSYQKLVDLGWQGDGLHVATAADQFRGMLMLRDTGLLNSYGRTMHQGGPRLPKVNFGRVQDTTTIGIVQAENTFGLDLELRTNRRFLFRTLAGTDGACIDLGGANASFMPDRTRIGSATGPAFWQLGQGRIAAVRGDNVSVVADVQARSFVIDPATQSSASGAITCDLSTSGAHVLTLTGNVTSFAFTNAPASGGYVEIHFVQDATGSRTLAGVSTAIKWSGGTAPILTTTASRRDIFFFRQIGSGTWFELGRSMNVG